MPLSGSALVELTPIADPLVARGVGAKASEEAQAARRVAEFLADRPRVTLSVVMRRCDVPAAVMARLVHMGALALLEADPAADTCERCNRAASPGTTICSPCREYLGWARLAGRDVPEAPTVIEPLRTVTRRRATREGMRARGGRRSHR
ncbi:MAG TPA: hypothetical protein VNT51_11345 [Miltoncostaeaceae bacterium]|nr:hypothetical protein [Miltoncostaeaceae bacterium]